MAEEDFDIGAWGSTTSNHFNSKVDSTTTPPDLSEEVSSVLQKEKLLREIRDFQEGLKALIERGDDVTRDCEKLRSQNETLAAVIQNMSKSTTIGR